MESVLDRSAEENTGPKGDEKRDGRVNYIMSFIICTVPETVL
jgi:hypothetical protein